MVVSNNNFKKVDQYQNLFKKVEQYQNKSNLIS